MQRTSQPSQRGFTLIELLVVIAIVAILAAILFPVFGRVRENARQGTCFSNMHQLYVAASLYKQDYGVYPCMLLGPAERADGLPWADGDSQPPVPASQVKYGSYLYPAYIKDISVFHCPDNLETDLQKTTTACLAPGSPLVQFLIQKNGHDEPHYPGCIKNLPANLVSQYSNKMIEFYAYDSYDISSAPMADGHRMMPMMTNLGCYIVYWTDWTGARMRGLSLDQDATNQLKYPDPPLDKTVLTWCNYHVTTASADKSPVLLASGTASPLDYRQMLTKGWGIISGQ